MTTRSERGRTAGVLVAFLALLGLFAWFAVNATAFLPVTETPSPRPGITTTPNGDRP